MGPPVQRSTTRTLRIKGIAGALFDGIYVLDRARPKANRRVESAAASFCVCLRANPTQALTPDTARLPATAGSTTRTSTAGTSTTSRPRTSGCSETASRPTIRSARCFSRRRRRPETMPHRCTSMPPCTCFQTASTFGNTVSLPPFPSQRLPARAISLLHAVLQLLYVVRSPQSPAVV